MSGGRICRAVFLVLNIVCAAAFDCVLQLYHISTYLSKMWQQAMQGSEEENI